MARDTSVRCALLAMIAGLTACASGNAPTTDPAPVTIYLLSDERCQVGSWELSCADVPTYLHDVLRTGSGTPIAIESLGNPSYKATDALVQMLGKAGFKMGYVTSRGPEK